MICDANDLGANVDTVADKLGVSIGCKRRTCNARLTVSDGAHGVKGVCERARAVFDGFCTFRIGGVGVTDTDRAAAFAEALGELIDDIAVILLGRDGEMGTHGKDHGEEFFKLIVVGLADHRGIVATGLFRADIRTLDVNTCEIGGGLCFFDFTDSAQKHIHRRGHDGGVYGGDTRFGVSKRELAEVCRVCGHGIDAASAVGVYVDKTRHEITARAVDDGIGEAGVCDDAGIFKAERTFFKSSFVCVVNVYVFNFGNHDICSLFIFYFFLKGICFLFRFSLSERKAEQKKQTTLQVDRLVDLVTSDWSAPRTDSS